MINSKIMKEYEEQYFANYEPVPYTLRDGYILNIYPALVKEWAIFENSVYILTQDKNSINDADIIRMSYLEFLYNLINYDIVKNGEDGKYRKMLLNVFVITFKDEKGTLYSFDKYNDRICLSLYSDNEVKCRITAKDLKEITEIIMRYNFIEYSDKQYSEDILRAVNDFIKLKSKNSRQPSLEEKKAYVISKTGIDFKDINDMPYRLFDLIFSCNLGFDSFIGDKIIQGSYKYKVDEDIQHPLYAPKRDILSEVFQDSDSIKQKVSQGAKA